MTKNELMDAIRASGTYVSGKKTKEELQAIYDGLHVHRERTQEETEETPEEKSEELPEEKPEELPEEKPEEKPGAEPGEVTPPGDVDFNELMGKIGGATPPEPKVKKESPLFDVKKKKTKKGESSPEAFYMEGYVLLLVVDTIFPFAFAFLNNVIDKKTKVDASELQLSDKDFTKLEPLADQAASYLAVGLNPVAGFLLVSTFMYSNNLMLIRSQKS